MTIVHTDLSEERLLEAIREAMHQTPGDGDPGLSIREMARALYGNDHATARDKISKTLQPLLAKGTWVRGHRHAERIDGQPYQITVFRQA